MKEILLLPLLLGIVLADQSIIEGPQETFIGIGKTVILKCKVENQKGAVQWMKNGFGLGIDRALKFFPRYSMVGSVSKGEYNLQIVNVTISDDDIYACQISEAANEAAVVSNPAKLSVLMRPSAPKLMKSTHILTAIAGDTITQSCVSKKGKPPPRLGWAISNDADGKHIITWLAETRSKFGYLYKTDGITQESVPATVNEQIQKDGQVYSVISNLSYIPRPEDDRKFLVCLSQHETFPNKVESDSLKLSLQYAPTVKLLVASQQRLKEGGSALLACNVDAKPLDNVKISWFRKGKQPLHHSTDTFAIETLKMEDHGVEYSCQASNVIGTNSASLKLDVSYGPRIMSTSQDKEVNEGEMAAFRCDATGNPAPTIFWTKAGDDQIIAKGDQLVIENVKGWQQGEYICTATVEGFKHATMSNYLHIRGAPIASIDEVVTAEIGKTAEISCRITGRPKPPEVKWSKNGEEINYASGRMKVHQLPRPFGIESRLTITDLKESDLGMYNCTANNGLGADAKGTYLRSKSVIDVLATLDSSTIIPLAAGILMLALCLCCCLLCRRRGYNNKKGSKFIDDQSDVTVKCEALDGQYYPEMYSSPLDNGNIITSKDYISIPQNNPDLDYLGSPSTFGGSLYPKYINNSIAEYNLMGRYDASYGSFASGISTPGGMSDMYGLPSEKGPVLETLQEVDTPKTSNYNFMAATEQQRSLSRTSTHV